MKTKTKVKEGGDNNYTPFCPTDGSRLELSGVAEEWYCSECGYREAI